MILFVKLHRFFTIFFVNSSGIYELIGEIPNVEFNFDNFLTHDLQFFSDVALQITLLSKEIKENVFSEYDSIFISLHEIVAIISPRFCFFVKEDYKK